MSSMWRISGGGSFGEFAEADSALEPTRVIASSLGMVSSRRRGFVLERLALLDIEAASIDGRLPSGRAHVLHVQDVSGLLGQKSMLEVGVGMEDHRSGTVLHAVDLEHAIEDVPDLGEVVVMERMPGPLLVAH